MKSLAVKTRLLVISDTHGMDFAPSDKPLPSADIAIHCGDLTDGSKLEEFHTTIGLLKSIDAPLKLVIAGNHDFTLDIPAFEKKVSEARPALEPDLVRKFYGANGDARELFETDDVKDSGIVFLDEGIHRFHLDNGASMTVYASPYTPSLGAWGFQYPPESQHNFDMSQATVDIVMTHGPPRGIMDYTHGRERAGCPQLFAAIARAKPRIHCFGHIHEGWGAKLVSWKDNSPEKDQHDNNSTHFTAIDNANSLVIEKISTLSPSRFEADEDVKLRLERVKKLQNDKCCKTSHCTGDDRPLNFGQETLFINAANSGDDQQGNRLTQKPWLVDIELPRLTTTVARATTATAKSDILQTEKSMEGKAAPPSSEPADDTDIDQPANGRIMCQNGQRTGGILHTEGADQDKTLLKRRHDDDDDNKNNKRQTKRHVSWF